MTTVLTSLLLAIGLLIQRFFGVSVRNSEQIWKELSLLLTRQSTYKSGRYLEFYQGEYIPKLLTLAEDLEKDSFNPFNPHNLKYSRTIREAREVAESLRLQDMNTLLRRQPFGILIGGKPGTGKSMSAMKMGALVLKLAGIEPSQKNMITLNEGDDFQSEFRSYHKCVIFDDLGATRSTLVGQDPFRKVIDFINNVPRTSLNPHLELKGNVWIEPEVVVATTNLNIPLLVEQGNNIESLMCPDAINRRFKIMFRQIGYDRYQLAEFVRISSSGIQRLEGSELSWDQVEQLITKAYKEHSLGQDTYLSLLSDIVPYGVRKEIRPESSGLGWYLVIAFQSVMRVVYYRLILEGNWSGDALILLNIRRFLAIPLNQVRDEQRKIIQAKLFEIGFSRRAIASMLDSRATVTRLVSGVIPTAIEIILAVYKGDSISKPVTDALAVRAFDYAVRTTLPRGIPSLVYDMHTIFFGSIIGRFLHDSVDNGVYATSFLPRCLSFIPSLVSVIADKLTGIIRPRVYVAEAKKIPQRYKEHIPATIFYSDRIFKFATQCGKFNRSEVYSQADEVYELSCYKTQKFIKTLVAHKPLHFDISVFMESLGSSLYGDLYVTPFLRTTKNNFVRGHEFLMIYDRVLDTFIVLCPYQTTLQHHTVLLKRLAILERRLALNVAFVECKASYIQLASVRNSSIGSVRKMMDKMQNIYVVASQLLLLDNMEWTEYRQVVGYRDTKQRAVTAAEEREKPTLIDESAEETDRAAGSM